MNLPNDPFIIAEIGINHNGDIEIAKKLIDMAKAAGVDAVKFQKRTLNIVYSKEALDTPRESPWGTTTREQKQGLEFGKEEYDIIDAYCKKVGIEWFASAWDLESQEFLKAYNSPYNKIASTMTTYTPLLEMVAKEKKPTFISTGMCTDEEIARAVEIFRSADCPFMLMHCVATYPSRDEDLNLNAINTLRRQFNCPVGYSGHETGVTSSVLAVLLGAKAIERHITLDRTMYGSDQAASLEKRGVEILVRDSRLVKVMLGDGKRKILDGEKSVAKKLRWFEEPRAKLKSVSAG